MVRIVACPPTKEFEVLSESFPSRSVFYNLDYTSYAMKSLMGTALDLETEDLEINPSSPPNNCESGTNPVASLSLLPV